jgi:hypothetical protein
MSILWNFGPFVTRPLLTGDAEAIPVRALDVLQTVIMTIDVHVHSIRLKFSPNKIPYKTVISIGSLLKGRSTKKDKWRTEKILSTVPKKKTWITHLKNREHLIKELKSFTMFADTPHCMVTNGNLPLCLGCFQRN